MGKNSSRSGPRSKRRQHPRKDTTRRYLVVTEGTVTEPMYFELLGQFLRSAGYEFSLTVKPKTTKSNKPKPAWDNDPLSVVKAAITQKQADLQKHGRSTKGSKNATRLSKKQDIFPFAEVFAVVDFDEWDSETQPKSVSTLDSAIKLAQQENIKLIISNLSFEVWLLWHKQNYANPSPNGLKKSIKDAAIVDRKSLRGDFPIENFPEAIKRANKNSMAFYEKGAHPGSAMPRFFEVVMPDG